MAPFLEANHARIVQRTRCLDHHVSPPLLQVLVVVPWVEGRRELGALDNIETNSSS
jgi:hypothetical protein